MSQPARCNAPTRGVAPWFVLGSVVIVASLHLAAAFVSRERPARDRPAPDPATAPAEDAIWPDTGAWRDIEDGHGRVVQLPGAEPVAVFRYDGFNFDATGNVCRHQGGPLGEGRIIDGCITCPWHGFQYWPEDGCAPAPFDEKIETHPIRIVGDRVEIDPTALPPGTPRDVAIVPTGDRT